MVVLTRRIRTNESVVSAELDSEAVLLNVETGIYFGLDELGSRVWSLIEGGCQEDEIVDALLHEYEVQPAQLRTDVDAFVAHLIEKGLVEAEPGGRA